MTGLLKSVLQEHADTTAGDVDLAAIVAAGDRKVRRNRLFVTAGAALAAAAVIGSLQVLPLGSRDKGVAVLDGFTERQPSWAIGSTIHFGESTFDVGHRVRSYVITDDGFVFATADRTVYFYDGQDLERIGQVSSDLALRSSATGGIAAWIEMVDETPALVAYDTSLRREVLRTSQTALGADQAQIYAVEGDLVFWRSSVTLVRTRIGVGSEIQRSGRRALHVFDAENNVQAQADTEEDPITVTRIGIGTFHRVTLSATGPVAILSPDGRYVTTEDEDVLGVFDTRTGQDLSPDLGGPSYSGASQWLDGDTYVAMVGHDESRQAESYPMEIYTCSASERSCAEYGSLEISSAGFALPIGLDLVG